MLYRIEAGLFPQLDDTIGRKTAASIREALGILNPEPEEEPENNPENKNDDEK